MSHDAEDDHSDKRFDDEHKKRENDDLGKYADVSREIDLWSQEYKEHDDEEIPQWLDPARDLIFEGGVW